ncbi:unnamed protein product [Adineta steineri]|uniref:Nucleotide-diphospho-sugar transferase domain-containing protein n=3 Tax=Adineta steineri TaxID=433720 RepID=A0A813T8P1_9BILA|nr:unnamed protein product [Adineta steineri]
MTFQYYSRKTLLWIILCLILLLSAYVVKNANIIHTPDLNFPVSSISDLPLNSTPSEAFVTFCNNNPKYLALLTNVFDSIHSFSTRPIIVYGIDTDLNIDIKKYPRVIKRRLSQKDCGNSIYFCKFYVIVHSQVDYGIYLEADTLVNWNVDILFDLLHRWPYPLPLAPRHPDDPTNYRSFLKTFKLDFQNRTTPYVHAHVLWNYRAYPFLQQAHNLMRQNNFLGANFDETGLNILLWQARANHTLL